MKNIIFETNKYITFIKFSNLFKLNLKENLKDLSEKCNTFLCTLENSMDMN